MRLLWKTTCAGLWVGSGIAAEWITASWPRTTAKAAPASVRSVCTYAASAGSGRSNTGAPRSVEVTSCPAARRASTVARPTLPRPPDTRMRMARNLLAARAVSAGPQPVAGGSCRRITLLRLRRLRLRTCPPPPAVKRPCRVGRMRPRRGPRASTPSRPQLLRRAHAPGSPPEYRATVVCLRLGEPAVRQWPLAIGKATLGMAVDGRRGRLLLTTHKEQLAARHAAAPPKAKAPARREQGEAHQVRGHEPSALAP